MTVATATFTVEEKHASNRLLDVFGTVAFGASPLTYAAGGLVASMAAISRHNPLMLELTSLAGHKYEWVKGATPALQKIKILDVKTLDMNIADVDGADGVGLLVYVHVDELTDKAVRDTAHLESITAGNADAAYAIGEGGPGGLVLDDDAAATAGSILYLDEDDPDPSARLASANTTGLDAYLRLNDGSFLRIVYKASPQTAGVAIYFDDDATNDWEALMFVSPTDADGRAATTPLIGRAGELAAAVLPLSVSGDTTRFHAVYRKV